MLLKKRVVLTKLDIYLVILKMFISDNYLVILKMFISDNYLVILIVGDEHL
jgi:hypothetical protein